MIVYCTYMILSCTYIIISCTYVIISCTYVIIITYVQVNYHVRTNLLSYTYNIINVYELDNIMYVQDS